MSYSYQFLSQPIYRAVLRALVRNGAGCYIDINPLHPSTHSLTNTLYEMGWLGVNLEPVPDYLAYLHKVRPNDINLSLQLGLHSSEFSLSGIVKQYCPAAIHLLRVNRLGKNSDGLSELDWRNPAQRPWVLIIENDQQYLNFHPEQTELLKDYVLAQNYSLVLFDQFITVLVANEHPLLVAQVSQINQANLALPRASFWKKLQPKNTVGQASNMSRWQLLKNLLIKIKTVIADGRLLPVIKQRAKKIIKPLLGRILHLNWVRKLAYFLMDRVSIVHHLAAMMKEGPSSQAHPVSTTGSAPNQHSSLPSKAYQMSNNNGSQQTKVIMNQLQNSIKAIKDEV
jgi:hypothetical protein